MLPKGTRGAHPRVAVHGPVAFLVELELEVGLAFSNKTVSNKTEVILGQPTDGNVTSESAANPFCAQKSAVGFDADFAARGSIGRNRGNREGLGHLEVLECAKE